MTRPLFRIALAEAKRQAGIFDRRVLIAALVVGLVLGLSWPVIQDGGGVRPDAGIYVVGVSGPTPLEGVIDSEPTFLRVVPGEDGYDRDELDLLIRGDQVSYDPEDDKSKAALRQLEGATNRWLDEAYTHEEDQGAAFPVHVNAVYQTRTVVGGPGPGPADQDPTPAPGDDDQPEADGNQTGGNQTGDDQNQTEAPGDDDPGLLQEQGSKQTGLRPDQLDPPFPLESLLLTFAYLIPLTFISELYSGSIFAEKIRQRGIILLSGPVTSAEVLIGKSLPYVAVMAVIAIGVTVAIGSNIVGLAAVIPIVAFVLAASLFLSIVSRSQRALTFLLVSTNVGLSTFLFLPALFTQIEPVAFLSPVAVISATIRGDPVSLGPFLYATVPMAVAAATLTGLSAASYKADTLFTPGGVFTRIADGLSRTMGSWRSFLMAGALSVPFAFAAELFVLIFAVTLDLGTAFFVFLIGSALVEEVLKAAPSYSHYTRSTRSSWAPWKIGTLIGLGFFLGEKGALAFTLLGFGLLPRGDAALLTFGIAGTPLLVLAPLLLHIGTATITAYAARKGKTSAGLGLISAVLIHATYNLLVVRLNLGGGGF